ncbi:MAG: hypothetical protein Q8M96_11130, partial [Rubrivivax sp.]|nr:hypothetical protein [Rubrivivax sp.]
MQTSRPTRMAAEAPPRVRRAITWLLPWTLATVLAGCDHPPSAPRPSGLFAVEAAATPCPAVGAIRWDAWFGSKGVPG